MLLNPEQRYARCDSGKEKSFSQLLENYSGSFTCMKGLGRLIKKNVTVEDWKRYRPKVPLEKNPAIDAPIIKEASPAQESVSVLNTNALQYHYLNPKAPANDVPIRKGASPSTSESVFDLNTFKLLFTRLERRHRLASTSESVFGLNNYHCITPVLVGRLTRPNTPANDDPMRKETSLS